MCKAIIVLASMALVVLAEPPVGQQNGYNSGGSSSQYGPPGNGRFGDRGFNQLAGQNGGGFNGYDSANGEESEPANYEFKYDVEDQQYGVKFGHQENRQGDVAIGSYYVLLPDGRTQHVEYQADQDGYKPKISYEEAQGGYARGGPGSQGGQNGYSRDGPGSQGGQNGYSRDGPGSQGGQNGYSRDGPGSQGGQNGYSRDGASGSNGVNSGYQFRK